MSWRIGITGFCAGAAFGFWAEVLVFSLAFVFAIIFSVLTCVFGFSIVFKLIWPGRDKWLAEFKHHDSVIRTLDLQGTLSKDRRLSWTTPEPQAVGDTYGISFGKNRVIDGIEFHEKFPSNEFPSKWTLLFENSWGGG